MIVIKVDQIVLGDRLRLLALGGPEDSVDFTWERNSGGSFELTASEIDQLQRAIVNFQNTGNFNQEA